MSGSQIGKSLMGLSPRVRGNRDFPGVAQWHSGSIPACAGEPAPYRGISDMGGVYPRVCGGTADMGVYASRELGLSPRVRGNLVAMWGLVFPLRSIPACAGEPGRLGLGMDGGGVYPRVCGGTLVWTSLSLPPWGLSPRVRGNLAQPKPAAACARSIPACAGEPGLPGCPTAPMTVYPRVCGGTTGYCGTKRSARGLSPRVRGNPGWEQLGANGTGSIPACAGEPHGGSPYPSVMSVYPRVCGGTHRN